MPDSSCVTAASDTKSAVTTSPPVYLSAAMSFSTGSTLARGVLAAQGWSDGRGVQHHAIDQLAFGMRLDDFHV